MNDRTIPAESVKPTYTELLHQAVEEALDTPNLYCHGTLYQDDMKDFVRRKLGDNDGVVENFLGTFHFTDPTYQELKTLSDQVRNSPRGTWLIFEVKYKHRPGETFFEPRISAGGGELGAHSDTYSTPPSFEKTRDRLVGYEVYKMRGRIDMERRLKANRAALERLALRPNQSFKDVKFRGEKPFSTITVENIDRGKGEVSFLAKRRGSPKTYRFSVGGVILEYSLQKTKPKDTRLGSLFDAA